MHKLVSLALLVGGIILLGFGLSASESLSSTFSRAFTGAPTDQALWLLIGGAILAVWGAAGLLRGVRHP